jgi:hypothetical protein
MGVRRVLIALLPLLVTGCGGGDCIDIGIPSGVQVVTDDYKAAPGTVVEVCAGQSCGSLSLADPVRFLPLALPADDEVQFVVTIRDAAAQQLVRSTLTVPARPVTDSEACDSGGPQPAIRLDAAGKAHPTN